MKRLTILLALCAIGTASAADIVVSVVHPTQYTDNTPIASGQIKQTRVEVGSCVGADAVFGTKGTEAVLAGTVTSQTFTGIPDGTYCFRAFTTVGSRETLPSNVVRLVVATALQAKPPVLTVTLK